MSSDGQAAASSKPWYMGWRGIAAGAAALLVLFMVMSPSEEKLAEKRAAKVREYCVANVVEEDGPDLSYVCDCVEEMALADLRNGTSPDEVTAPWYKGMEFACLLTATPPELEDWKKQLEKSEEDLRRSEELLRSFEEEQPEETTPADTPEPEEVSVEDQEELEERQQKLQEEREARRQERLRRLEERRRSRGDRDPPR